MKIDSAWLLRKLRSMRCHAAPPSPTPAEVSTPEYVSGVNFWAGYNKALSDVAASVRRRANREEREAAAQGDPDGRPPTRPQLEGYGHCSAPDTPPSLAERLLGLSTFKTALRESGL